MSGNATPETEIRSMNVSSTLLELIDVERDGEEDEDQFVHSTGSHTPRRPVEETRADLERLFDVASSAGIRVVYAPLTRSGVMAKILGESGYDDAFHFWDPDRWDALGELIAVAADHDVEVHAWYSFTRSKSPRELAPEYDPDNEVLPPGDPDWASIRREEFLDGHVDPADPAVEASALCNNEHRAHEWTLRMLDQLFERYPELNGLRIEEPGYLDPGRCVCYRCQAVYEQLYGEPGANLLAHVHEEDDRYEDDDRALAVKTRGTDDFVRRLVPWWNREHADRVLSYNGSWNPTWDRVRGRNWPQWAEEGLVPYFSPQIYTTDLDEFGECLRTTMEAVSGTPTAIVPSVAMKWVGGGGGTNTPETLAEQIELAREIDGHAGIRVAGVNLFTHRLPGENLVEAFAGGPYARPASLPWRAE